MNWSYFFTSVVGRKLVMALTGLFLISFLIIHAGLNSCIFNDLAVFNEHDNGEMFNKAAAFMGNSWLIRLIEIGLFAGFLLHIIQGYVVELKNRGKRKKGYKVAMGSRGSTWMSRSMALLGTLIFLYLIMHIAHFWIPSRVTHTLQEATYYGKTYHNLYLRMYEVFQQGWVVALYLVGVASLCFHLLHGFHSAFRSVGVHNRKYLVLLKGLGYGFSAVVCLLFALMPISMYLHWINPFN